MGAAVASPFDLGPVHYDDPPPDRIANIPELAGSARFDSSTIGVTEQLLPFGNQIPVLQRLQADWFLVIPVVGLLVGVVAALVGARPGSVTDTRPAGC